VKSNPTICPPREPLANGFLGYLISLKEQQEWAAQRAAEGKLRDAVLQGVQSPMTTARQAGQVR